MLPSEFVVLIIQAVFYMLCITVAAAIVGGAAMLIWLALLWFFN
jgi:hypothetical protein